MRWPSEPSSHFTGGRWGNSLRRATSAIAGPSCGSVEWRGNMPVSFVSNWMGVLQGREYGVHPGKRPASFLLLGGRRAALGCAAGPAAARARGHLVRGADLADLVGAETGEPADAGERDRALAYLLLDPPEGPAEEFGGLLVGVEAELGVEGRVLLHERVHDGCDLGDLLCREGRGVRGSIEGHHSFSLVMAARGTSSTAAMPGSRWSLAPRCSC